MNQEQKFSVGDRVIIVSEQMPIEYRKKVYRVIAAEYDYFINSNDGTQEVQWAYELSLPMINGIEWYTDNVLRPYDPPSDDSLEEMIEKINSNVIEVNIND